jgi:hypothetical protein
LQKKTGEPLACRVMFDAKYGAFIGRIGPLNFPVQNPNFSTLFGKVIWVQLS